jgi:hypothetical protein
MLLGLGALGIVYSAAVIVSGKTFIRTHRVMSDGSGYWLEGSDARIAGLLGVAACLVVIVLAWLSLKKGDEPPW